MQASLLWWHKGEGHRAMSSQDFADYHSDAFDVKLSELLMDDSVAIIEIMKGERPTWALQSKVKRSHLESSL